MNGNQPWLPLAGGAALLAWGLSRRSLVGLAVAAGGGYLAYRTARQEWARPTRRDDALPVPQTGTDPETSQWYPPPEVDPVDEASMDSFPASDPPSYMSSARTRSMRP